jgi:hypothetical protein
MINPFNFLESIGSDSRRSATDTSGKTVAQTMPLIPTVSSVPINYTPGTAPSFNKTLKDYLADKQLQGLVNQNIFATNKPLLAANQAERRTEGRNVLQNAYIGRGLQASHQVNIDEQKAINENTKARAATRAEKLKAETALAESQVPITYMEGEASKAKADAQEAGANEKALSDALVDRLAASGEQYLAALKAAQGAQTRVDEQKIRQAADDAVRSNVSLIRGNQAQRGTLLGTLAAEQLQNDINLHNTAIGQYNDTENRKYQSAADAAKMAYDAQVQNANNTAALLGSSEDSKPEKNANREAAVKRVELLNKQLDKLRSSQELDERTGKVILSDAVKQQIKAKIAIRDKLREKWGI